MRIYHNRFKHSFIHWCNQYLLIFIDDLSFCVLWLENDQGTQWSPPSQNWHPSSVIELINRNPDGVSSSANPVLGGRDSRLNEGKPDRGKGVVASAQFPRKTTRSRSWEGRGEHAQWVSGGIFHSEEAASAEPQIQ